MTSYFDLDRRITITAPPKLDQAFERLRRIGRSADSKLLSKYTGGKISEREARVLWPLIADHKWYLSEQLSRDVGFHIAAVDYVENFYEPISGERFESKMTPYIRSIRRQAGNAIRFYFETKGQTPAL